jgi:lipid-A-disaccharide synthase
MPNGGVPRESATSICFVAGEPSGDLQGSLLCAALKRRHPEWRLWGVGGDLMAVSGCELWRNARSWSVMGFAEVIKALPKFRERLNSLVREIESRRPAAVVLIDFPGFNLKLAKRVHALGIPVMYYIVPQLWAWGQGRIEIFRKCIDRTVAVFPFEKEFFESRGVHADWIGHPLVDYVQPRGSRTQLREALGVGSQDKLVALLPGSRLQDFESHLPTFAEAVKQLGDRIEGVRWALGLAPSLSDQVRPFLERAGREPVPLTTAIYDLMSAADVVLTKTGTATVECAIIGTPMVTVYKTGWLNYAIARRVVKVPFIAMPNLIANKSVVPELIQDQATPTAISEQALRILTDPKQEQSQREGLAMVRERLGAPGAVGRAVTLIEEWLSR